ncbi:MAG: TetR/AcrR family transcriptional regulator [Gaiellaceae bacterium]
MEGIEQAPPRSARDRVDEILRAACRVIVSEGAHALRIGGVAVEAGVSRTLVHYYFQTRKELLRAAFAFAEDRRVQALEAELEQLTTGAEKAERALLRTIEPALEEMPALWNEVWSSLRDDAELGPLARERYRMWAERVIRLLEEGHDDGSVPRAVDPYSAGWRLAATADGLESILYLGLLDSGAARALLTSCVERELAA